MSILVKNMWMPDDCFDCPMCHQIIFKNSYKSHCYVLDKMCPDDGERLAECPLIDVEDDETIRINLNEPERKKFEIEANDAEIKMSELVDKQKIIHEAERLANDFKACDGGSTCFCIDGHEYDTDTGYAIDGIDAYVEVFTERINALQPAQPEIIRCKDCKHWKEGTVYSYCNKLFGMGVLDVYDYMTEEDDFCSGAERRTDGE